jgi:hypothetical protein
MKQVFSCGELLNDYEGFWLGSTLKRISKPQPKRF